MSESRQPLVLAEVLAALRKRALWPVWLATFLFSGLAALFMVFATVTAESRGIAQPANLWFTYAAGAVSVRALGARLPEEGEELRHGNVVLKVESVVERRIEKVRIEILEAAA